MVGVDEFDRAATLRRGGFAHQPALDGVRGLSVVLVLLFHGGFGWAAGGYVGVSVFFTLSGFLITRLLLRELATTGSISITGFWMRRARRLLPAALAGLVLGALLTTTGAIGEAPGVRHDVLGALLQVANWFQLAGTETYAEQVIGLRSPVDHYWSLAIEEQFYWLWPAAMLLIARSSRQHRVIVALTIAAGAAAPLIAWWWGSDAAYWATPARAAEILVGASLAALLHRRRTPPPRRVSMLGVPALGVIAWATLTWPASGGPAYAGWLPVFAVASGALVLALQVASPLRRALSLRPLAALGAVSYGVYVYHWPVFLYVDARLDVGRSLTFAAGSALTLAMAIVSYRLIEQPVRRGRGHPLALVPSGAVLAVATVMAVATTPHGVDRFADPAAAIDQIDDAAIDGEVLGVIGAPTGTMRQVEPRPVVSASIADPLRRRNADLIDAGLIGAATNAEATAASATPGVGDPEPEADVAVTGEPTRPVRILVVGDSTAWALGDGLAVWAYQHPALASVALRVAPGCGFIREGVVPADAGAAYAEQCRTVLDEWTAAAISELHPDVVMLMSTRTDVKDREWSPDEGVLPNFDERFQTRQLSDYERFTGWLLEAGVPRVAWVKPPVVRPDPAPPDEMTDPARMAIMHDIIDAAADTDPRVAVIDLGGWYAGSGIDDAAARLDGMHFELEAATQIADRFVGPALVNAAVAP